jgi:hypothetical protein
MALPANAALIFAIDNYTTDELSFSISGTFDSGAQSAVPLPATVWLFGSGLLGLIGMARRKKVA